MTDAKTEGLFQLTQPVVMSFPNLFVPKPYMENGKAKGDPKYSCNLNFEAASSDLEAIKKLAAKLARAKWPDKPFFVTTTDGVKIQQIFFPFASGDKLADDRKAKGKNDGEYTRGKVVIAARSKFAPILSYFDGKIIDLTTDMAKEAAKGRFYSGVEVLAEINLVPYNGVGNDGKPGVAAYLNRVMSTGKGVAISGGKSSAETFKGYVGSVSTDNPMAPGGAADMSDEIPY